jgi:hypothetical protein
LTAVGATPPVRYAASVRTLRLYDASRQPRDWMDIIEPGQFAVFASMLDGDAPTDVNGVPTTHEAATCVIVDSLADAEVLCHGLVEWHPGVRYDIFDASGRSRPPMHTVVHPSQASTLEGNARIRRRNQVIAVVLLVAAPVLFWIDWHSEGSMVLPTLLGFNALVFAGRLLQLNAGYAAAERRRLERVERGDQST